MRIQKKTPGADWSGEIINGNVMSPNRAAHPHNSKILDPPNELSVASRIRNAPKISIPWILKYTPILSELPFRSDFKARASHFSSFLLFCRASSVHPIDWREFFEDFVLQIQLSGSPYASSAFAQHTHTRWEWECVVLNRSFFVLQFFFLFSRDCVRRGVW